MALLQPSRENTNFLKMILQFMKSSGMDASHETFQKECEYCGFSFDFDKWTTTGPEEKSTTTNNNSDPILPLTPKDILSLYKAIDENDQETLAQLLTRLTEITENLSDDNSPESSLKCDLNWVIINLHVLKSTIPYKLDKSLEDQTKAMSDLKILFQERAYEMSADSELLSLFALPFVSEPHEHPVFRLLYEPGFARDLKSKICAVFKRHYEMFDIPTVADCQLVKLCLTPDDDSQLQVQQTVELQRLTEMEKMDTKCKQLEGALLETEVKYHKLLKVTSETILTLEEVLKGHTRDWNAFKQQLTSLYPELFKMDPPTSAEIDACDNVPSLKGAKEEITTIEFCLKPPGGKLGSVLLETAEVSETEYVASSTVGGGDDAV